MIEFFRNFSFNLWHKLYKIFCPEHHPYHLQLICPHKEIALAIWQCTQIYEALSQAVLHSICMIVKDALIGSSLLGYFNMWATFFQCLAKCLYFFVLCYLSYQCSCTEFNGYVVDSVMIIKSSISANWWQIPQFGAKIKNEPRLVKMGQIGLNKKHIYLFLSSFKLNFHHQVDLYSKLDSWWLLSKVESDLSVVGPVVLSNSTWLSHCVRQCGCNMPDIWGNVSERVPGQWTTLQTSSCVHFDVVYVL